MPKFELWKPVIGWEGLYVVSSLGSVARVRANMTSQPIPKRRVAATSNQFGRLTVMLCDAPRFERRQLHRLVMAAFVGPCPAGYEVNHKDGNPKNNELSNLEYVTPSQNQLHAYHVLKRSRDVGHKGETNTRAKLTDCNIREIRLLYANNVGPTAIAAKFKVDRSQIHRVVKRTSWSHIQ